MTRSLHTAEVHEITAEEWAAFLAGPEGTCAGCVEPRFACQCEICHDCGRRHDRGMSCEGEPCDCRLERSGYVCPPLPPLFSNYTVGAAELRRDQRRRKRAGRTTD